MYRFFVWLFLRVAIGAALTGCGSSRSTTTQPLEEITLVTARPDIVQQPDEFMMVDEMPRVIGGLESIQKRAAYPVHLVETSVQGTVLIQLIVTENGELHDLSVARSVHPELDRIALDAVSKAQFTPGRIAGRPVPVQVRVPIRFYGQE